ncbi:MAG: sugar transferase [Candidatus Eremiobacteraeota bacterium]|nr:sugar transferase [Candidatus Eremiobacteraeota bacterium]
MTIYRLQAGSYDIPFKSRRITGIYDYLKRVIDVFLALFGLIISAPMWVIISILIKLESGGPIFFHKICYSKKGRTFRQWKFRSMVHNAEKDSGPILASQKDNRITRVGWFLRKTAMDELPQLINILAGDMSFVGPRPQRVVLVDSDYADRIPHYHSRHIVRPGLTGLAQVYGRYNTPPKNKLKYDLLYVKKYNLFLDLKLILMSFLITFRAKWQERGKKR